VSYHAPLPFDLQDGEAFVYDEEGTELPDVESAQIEAAETLAVMVNDLTWRVSEPSGHPLAIEVRDSAGSLFRLGFEFSSVRSH
jgi:hypothetical protein